MNSQSLPRLTDRPAGTPMDPAKLTPPAPRASSQLPALQRPSLGSASSVPTGPAIQRPSSALGGAAKWTPTLNSGTDRNGAPVYDNTSVQRLQTRRPDLPQLQSPASGRPDFSNVRTGTTASPPAASALRGMVGTNANAAPATPPAAAAQASPVLRPTIEPPRVSAPRTTAPDAQAASTRAVGAINANTADTRGRITSALLNPMGADAEMLRRLQNSQSSYMNKGSPQARRLAAQPYLEALGTANRANLDGMNAGNQVLSQAPSLEAAANEGAARRRLDADTFNVDAGYRERALATEAATRRAELDRPSLQTDAEGNLLQVSGTTASPVRGSDGTPVRVTRPATARDHQAAADDKLLADLIGLQKDPYGEYPADALDVARRQLVEIRSGQRRDDAQPAAPRAGDVLDGYRFRGGDPSNPANWEAQ